MLEMLGILVTVPVLYLLYRFWKYITGESSEEYAKDTQAAEELTRINIDQSITDNAIAFAGLCRKLAKGGGKSYSFPVKYKLRTTSMGIIEVCAVHTAHDNDLLLAAHNFALDNNQRGVEYTYNQMIAKCNLTLAELRSFQDVSDFLEFLHGGISGFNSCVRMGYDITITQTLGYVQENAKNVVLSKIEKAILSHYSKAKATTYGTMLLTIDF